MSAFDFTDGPRGSRGPRQSGPAARNPVAAWFLSASATFAGAFLAGLVLLLVVRWYVVESLREARAEAQKEFQKFR